MNEEGDAPSVSEVVPTTPMKSLNNGFTTPNKKNTGLTKHLRRIGTLTGISKSKAKVATDSTEEIAALQLKVSQLTKELAVSRAEIDRCKRKDSTEGSEVSSDESRAEFERFKLESQFEKNSLITLMENEAKQKTAEIEMLKIAHLKTEAEKESLIIKMECEIKMKSAEIDQLNEKLEANRVEIDQYKRESAEKKCLFSQLGEEIKLMTGEIQSLKIANLNAEAERNVLITQLECELKVKSAVIENLKMSGDVRSCLEKVERNVSRVLDRTTETTLRARFVVSTLTSQRTYSQRIEFVGMDWSIYVYTMDDYLSFYVEAMSKNESACKPCSAFIKWQLISQKSEEIVHSKKTKVVCVFTEDKPSWGFEFISLKDLFDVEKGYVKDDSIIVAAVIKAFPAN